MAINSTKKILLVEDNKGDVLIIEEEFEDDKDVVIDVVGNGEDAIKYLESGNNPKIIILDLNLPRMNGFDVLAHIKKSKTIKKLPIIILTTSKAEHDIDKAYELGANSYIIKPFEYEEFQEILRSIKDFWLRFAQLPD